MALNFNNNEQLERFFLLELLVDNVQLNYSKVDMRRSFLNTIQKTIVRFFFQDYPPVDVCEDDFCPMTSMKGNHLVPFKSGKACLFSLQELPPDLEYLEIGAEVYGQGQEPSRVLIARACMCLGELFKDVVREVQTGCQGGPVTRAGKSTYTLVGDNGVDVGRITLFVRVSCFGKKIVRGKADPCTDLGGLGDRGASYGYPRPNMAESGDLTGFAQSLMSQAGFAANSIPGMTMAPDSGMNIAMGSAYPGMGSMPQMGRTPGSGMNIGQGSGGPGMVAMPGMVGMGIMPGMGRIPGNGMNIGLGSGGPGMVALPGMASMGMIHRGGMNIGTGAGGMGGVPGSFPGSVGPGMMTSEGNIASMNRFPTAQQIDETANVEEECPGGKKDEKGADDPDKDKDVLKLEIGNKNKVGKRPKLEIVLKTPKVKFDEIKTDEHETQYLESDIVLPKPPAVGIKGKGKAKGGKAKKGKKAKKK